MSNDPTSPNYKPGVGHLVLDRFDAQKHFNGTSFRHDATMIDLSPYLVINSQTTTTVQQALQVLAGVISAPVIPQATIGTSVSNLGIITLGGDLSAVSSTALVPIVGGIQGRPIATTPPTSGQVLGWNGSAWGPVAANNFVAGNDLSGTATSQNVIGLTGSGNSPSRTVRASNDVIQFISTAVPYITQSYVSAINAGKMVIKAQGVSSGTGSGGILQLAGGAQSGSGRWGGISFAMGGDPAVDATGYNMFQLANLTGNQVIASFFPPNASGVTLSDMPVNSGIGVIYIGNTGVGPTVQSSTGTILWSASGKLNVMQSDGVSFPLQAETGGDLTGNYPNPTVAKIQGTSVSSSSPTVGQVFEFDGSQWAPANVGATSKAYFGDGSDGTVHFDGIATVLGLSPAAGGTYTLNNNISCTNITIDPGVTIETAGFIIMCTGNLVVDGYIDNSGSNASGSPQATTKGVGAPWGFLGGGSNGGDGLFADGSTPGISFLTNSDPIGSGTFSMSAVALGGIGGSTTPTGSPGATNNPLGGPGGFTFNASNLVLSSWLLSGQMLCSAPTSSGPSQTLVSFGGGTGGGAGAFIGGGKNGGGGGGGGGIILISANTISGSGLISANGGSGGSVTTSSLESGGGGGGGGVVIIIYGTNSFTGFVEVLGGLGGTATAGALGSNGNPGSPGTFVLCAG